MLEGAVNELLTEGTAEGDILQQGWALKTSKPPIRFDVDVKDYLIAKFVEGESSHQKYDPGRLSNEIRKERTTAGQPCSRKDHYLSANQIRSFWSRYSAKYKEGITPAGVDAPEEVDPDEYVTDPNFLSLGDQLEEEYGRRDAF